MSPPRYRKVDRHLLDEPVELTSAQTLGASTAGRIPSKMVFYLDVSEPHTNATLGDPSHSERNSLGQCPTATQSDQQAALDG
jgi:hypothetical protein